MKIRTIKPAYYNDEYLKVGRVIDFKGDKLPSWAEPVKSKNVKEQQKSDESKEPVKVNEPTDPTQPEGPMESNETEKQAEVDADADEPIQENVAPEAEMYLELLLNEATDKNIVIQDFDKKTVEQKIKELETLLGIDKDKAKCV